MPLCRKSIELESNIHSNIPQYQGRGVWSYCIGFVSLEALFLRLLCPHWAVPITLIWLNKVSSFTMAREPSCTCNSNNRKAKTLKFNLKIKFLPLQICMQYDNKNNNNNNGRLPLFSLLEVYGLGKHHPVHLFIQVATRRPFTWTCINLTLIKHPLQDYAIHSLQNPPPPSSPSMIEMK